MKIRVLLLVLAVLALTFALVSCGGGHEHDFKESEVISEATCDAAGKVKYACECGESEEREIEAKGHDWGEAIVVAPTCWDDGYTYQVCKTCETKGENTDIVKAGDEYHQYTVEKDIKKADCGSQTNGQRTMVCAICGDADPNLQPEQVKWKHEKYDKTVEATCSAAGSVTEYCLNCDYSAIKESLPQLPHDFKTEAVQEQTCTLAYEEILKCNECGYEETVTDEAKPALGHDFPAEPSVKPATCTTNAYYYMVCGRCGTNETLDEEVPNGEKLTHKLNYENYADKKDATCITAGYIVPTCDNEGCTADLANEINPETEESYIMALPATDEHYVSKEIAEGPFEATCHKGVYTVYRCTTDVNCTKTYEEVDASTQKNHYRDFNSEPNRTEESTCGVQGYSYYYCKECPADPATCEICEYKKPNPMPEHQKTTKSDLVDSTCMTPAIQYYICGECNNRWDYTCPTEGEGEDVVPLKQHGKWEVNKDEYNDDMVISPTCTEEGYTVYKCGWDDACTETVNMKFTRRVSHSFEEASDDGLLTCLNCKIVYRDVTTYCDDVIDSDSIQIGGANLNWELRGYTSPKEPFALIKVEDGKYQFVYVTSNEMDDEATTEYETKVDLSKGLIKIVGTADTTYEIVVKLKDGTELKYPNQLTDRGVAELKGEVVLFDLYATENVEQVTITASTDATVAFYSYEGK